MMTSFVVNVHLAKHVTCYVSCVTCHVSRVMCHVSCVMCHVSHVTCHMSHVTCHMSCVTCHIYLYFLFFLDKAVMLIGGGSVINGAYPSCLNCNQSINQFISPRIHLTGDVPILVRRWEGTRIYKCYYRGRGQYITTDSC